LPVFLAFAFFHGSLLVDQGMAGALGPGSVSSLVYGNKLVTLAVTVGSWALGTAVFPFFSRMAAAGDWRGLRASLRTYLALVLGVTVPLTALGCLASRPIVALLFQRGEFSEADTAAVAP